PSSPNALTTRSPARCAVPVGNGCWMDGVSDATSRSTTGAGASTLLAFLPNQRPNNGFVDEGAGETDSAARSTSLAMQADASHRAVEASSAEAARIVGMRGNLSDERRPRQTAVGVSLHQRCR